MTLVSPTVVESCPFGCVLRVRSVLLSLYADKGGSQVIVTRDQSPQGCLSRPRATHCFNSGS